MQRRSFLKLTAASAAAACIQEMNIAQAAEHRPNILWLTCEDMSPHLSCYGYSDSQTPAIDRLASEGARFERVFSVAAVCAPSRSCLISGHYPASLGTHHMRCKRALPPDFHCFPHYLRQTGYYCTNNVKTDYNFDAPADTWDESSNKAHWRNRSTPDQPFFSVFNFTTTHESSIGKLFAEDDPRRPAHPHDPDAVTLPPYYPDTPTIRKHWAHYLDLISLLDAWVDEHLHALEEAGLSDNTIVFFFSDHGAGLPRAKRWLYDSGLHVPLIVRWPGKVDPGSLREDLISFVDFAPTVVSLAGVTPPPEMQGQVFLGEHRAAPRQFVFGERDRMDERYDIIRAARDKRYKYIRNYDPFRAYDQHNEYQENWPVMQEMRRVQAEGKLDQVQQLFFRPTKPLEELYDCDTDPHELNNVAGQPEMQEHLERLRDAMNKWLNEIRDLGLVPEMVLAAWCASPPAPPPVESRYAAPETASAEAFGLPLAYWTKQLNQADPLLRLRAIRSIGLCGAGARPVLLAALQDAQETVVYWAATALGEQRLDDVEVIKALAKTLDHPSLCACLAAAQALLPLGQPGPALPRLLDAVRNENPFARLYAAQALESLAKENPGVQSAMNAALEDGNEYVVRIARHALGLEPAPK
ncbi:MAG: sulfatase-like hydrolase/transferase [Candidatus Hydrogenedentes bacterium]|nr:sulfatase-like hydrolase/transferase [Candidatus Hydrogenedentota bacterium]